MVDDAEATPRPAMRWLPVAAFACAAALAAAFFLHVRFFNDDSLITIRYAENLAQGHGLTYNPGEKALGTTTPLWALVLAGASAVGLDAPKTATWLGIAAFAWAAAMTAVLFRNRGVAWWGQALAAGLVATSPMLLTWAGAGMEVSLYVGLIATFLVLFEARRFATLGLVAGAMALVRPDAGLVIAAATLLGAWQERAVRPLLRAAPGFGLLVLPWIVGATLYFGSPLPNSGFAKRLQVEDWGTYIGALGRALWAVGPVLPLAAIGAAVSASKKETALPALALLAVAGGMHFGGLPGCGWYLAAPMYLVLVLAADGAIAAASRLAGAGSPLRSPAAFVALASPLLGHVLLAQEAHDLKIAQSQIDRCHGRIGTWLHDHAPQGASVGVDNIGYIGYRSGLRVIDMLGLIQPETAKAIAAGTRDYALRHNRPELIAMWVGRGNTWKYAPDDAWFAEQGYKIVFEAPLSDGKPRPAYAVFSRVEMPK